MKKVFIIALAAAAIAAISCNKTGTVDSNTVDWQGVTYKTVTLANGQTWMAENLRCIPAGARISDNPAEGTIFYPYEVVDGKAQSLKDDASIKKYGLLYGIETILGQKVTATNYQNFENAQGVCPEGWHVPSRADFIALCGYANKLASETVAPENHDAPFWTIDPSADKSEYSYGSTKKANELGWNFWPIGSILTSKYQTGVIAADKTDMADFVGACSMTYFASSTVTGFDETKGQVKLAAMMTTFTKTSFNEKTSKYQGYSLGRLSVADAIMVNSNNNAGAIAVRCIKNDTKK